MKEKEPFYQVPKSLFRLRRDGKLSVNAFDIYILMLDRHKVSKKNNWIDKEGQVYVLYTYEEISIELNLKRRNSIAEAIKELENLNFIKKKRRFNQSTIFYITDTLNSNETDTLNSNETDTLVIINNNNNLSNNKINNNNNSVAGIIRQEIHFLIKSRNIKIDNVLKYCSNLDRIKEVFSYADKNNKADAWIIACLRDNYKLEATKEKHKKNYDLTFDDI
nr:MAG TPA: replication initiator protein [Caudoviricetes sp.]